jgi:hypothetical protein
MEANEAIENIETNLGNHLIRSHELARATYLETGALGLTANSSCER